MSPEDWLWLPLGLLSLSFSTSIWKKARSGHRLDFSELLLAGGAGYGAWHFGDDLWSSRHLALQAVAAALWWCAASPVLSWVWYGGHGRVRARLWKVTTLLSCLIVGSVAGSFYLPLAEAVVLGAALAAFVTVLPWLRRRFRNSLEQWRWRRNEKRQDRHQVDIPPRPEDTQLIASLEKKAEAAEKEIRQQKLVLEEAQKRDESKAQRRQEIMMHVRRIRQEQRSAMEQRQQQGLHYHPSSYGFLLAEAGRVLRAEIRAGERVPAIEADPFLFDVVERLLQADDFETRYFHRAGAKAIAAVESYLAGDQPLDATRSTLNRLKLEPKLVAPEPLAEPFLNPLLEAWLEPHRKFQTQQWQLFNAKKHPEQGRLSDFLRTQGFEDPEAEQWRDCWDASPAPFVGKPIPAKSPKKTRRRWQLTNWRF